MLKKISTLPFQGTPEQEAKLKEVIANHKDDPGAVMPVLQEAQDIYGYLPIEVQQMIAEGLDVPIDEVYGVATFYNQNLPLRQVRTATDERGDAGYDGSEPGDQDGGETVVRPYDPGAWEQILLRSRRRWMTSSRVLPACRVTLPRWVWQPS